MVYKLFNLNVEGFMNKDVIQNPSSVEALNFISQNILVFEKTIFQTVYNLMSKIDTILTAHDGSWIKAFYFNRVAITNSDGSIDFYYTSAIMLQCICEILSVYKYVYLEQQEDPLEIPDLPDDTQLNDEDIPKFYKVDVPAKIQMFIETHS